MILTNGFDPDPRVYKEAKSLVNMGHNVEIICWDREGRYLDKELESIDGIIIRRFFSNATYGSGYKQIFKFKVFIKEVIKYLEKNSFDALHCHDFDGLYIGYQVKKRKNIPLTYDEHDLFYMYFKNRKGLLNKFISIIIQKLERRLLKKVDNHILVTDEMGKLYKNISKNVYIINNAPSMDTFKDIEKTKSHKLRIGYIGSIRYLNELKVLMDVCKSYEQKVDVIISGRGIELEELTKYSKNFNNVKITGGYTMSELEGLYKNIDITYAFYPSMISSISMPNKFYESIITETPIIANGFMEFGKVVKKHNLGFCIDEKKLYTELDRTVKVILDSGDVLDGIISNMRRIKKDYLWEANEKTLKLIYEGDSKTEDSIIGKGV